MMAYAVVVGIKQRMEKRIVVKGQESADKRKKTAKLAHSLKFVIIGLDTFTP